MKIKVYLFLIFMNKNFEKLRKIIKKEHIVIKLFILLKKINLKVILNRFIENE